MVKTSIYTDSETKISIITYEETMSLSGNFLDPQKSSDKDDKI